jgi:ankyrin repeat protein
MRKILLILSFLVTLNAGVMEDIEQFNRVLVKAKAGDPLYQKWLAERYYAGKGTQVDKKAALYWFDHSAKQGHISSMLMLANIYVSNATSKKIMQLGIKEFENLANYETKYPKLFNKNSDYQAKYIIDAHKYLVKLYIKGNRYIAPDTQKAKNYLVKLQHFSDSYRFSRLLDYAGVFCADEEKDAKNQADFIELIRKGADVNATYERDKGLHYSLLFYSIEKNNKELFELLLTKGVDINYVDEKGENAFYRAIWQHNLEFAKKLYEKGIKLDFNTTIKNPLVIAILDEKKELIEYLVSIGYKAKRNIIKQDNMLTFMLGDSYTQAKILNYKKQDISPEFIEWAVKSLKLDVNIQHNGYHPLEYVSMKRDMRQKVQLLLKLGADKNLKDKDGNTAKQFYEKMMKQNSKMIKKYENSKENKVRVVETKNKNIQGIIDNAFGKQYYYKDAVYEGYNKNLEEVIKLLSKYRT